MQPSGPARAVFPNYLELSGICRPGAGIQPAPDVTLPGREAKTRVRRSNVDERNRASPVRPLHEQVYTKGQYQNRCGSTLCQFGTAVAKGRDKPLGTGRMGRTSFGMTAAALHCFKDLSGPVAIGHDRAKSEISRPGRQIHRGHAGNAAVRGA